MTAAERMWSDVMSRPQLREADLRTLAATLAAAGDRTRARYARRLADDIAARMARTVTTTRDALKSDLRARRARLIAARDSVGLMTLVLEAEMFGFHAIATTARLYAEGFARSTRP